MYHQEISSEGQKNKFKSTKSLLTQVNPRAKDICKYNAHFIIKAPDIE